MKNTKFNQIIIVLIFGTLFFSICQGQDSTISRKGLKIYSNFSSGNRNYEKIKLPPKPGDINQPKRMDKKMQFGHISPAITFYTPKGNFMEIELTQLNISNRNYESYAWRFDSSFVGGSYYDKVMVDGGKTRTFFLNIRYEYDFLFLGNYTSKKIDPYVGVSINVIYNRFRTLPSISTTFPYRTNELQAILSLIFSANYNFTDRFFADINIPIKLVSASYQTMHIENPAVPVSQRTRDGFYINTNVISDFHGRLGIGLRI